VTAAAMAAKNRKEIQYGVLCILLLLNDPRDDRFAVVMMMQGALTPVARP